MNIGFVCNVSLKWFFYKKYWKYIDLYTDKGEKIWDFLEM